MNFEYYFKFKCSAESVWDIYHFVAATLLCKALFIETVKVMRGEDRKSIFEGKNGDVHKQCGDAMQIVSWCFMVHSERQLLCTVLYNSLPSLSAPLRWAESQKERLSTAVFVRGREGVSAWGLPACPAWACPYCQPGPSLPLGTAGTRVLNQRPIYPSHTPLTKWFLLVFCRLSVPGS